MKPIAIFRFTATEGPGYFAEFLDAHALSWMLIKVDAAERIPGDVTQFSGVVLMGGPMSVNDSLSWIGSVLSLIRDAVAHDIPVLGHCLGGQLMSKALGGVVTKNAVKEIGWGAVSVSDSEAARTWFGDYKNVTVFHWHGETFSLPKGAAHLLASQHCTNQAYALGKHLALQCHVEMTEPMIQAWCENGADEMLASSDSAGVQTAGAILGGTAQHLQRLHRLADRVYAEWVKGLV